MNAIILAAGMGTRLRPLTNDIPKCLVPINGIPMVEQQIRFLREAGIFDITLVAGYKAEALDYLKNKYEVEIILNDHYAQYNNIYSLFLVLDRFSNSYVIEGDIWMSENCFRTDLNHSSYFARWKSNYKNEWGLDVDTDYRLQMVTIGDGSGYLMSGISYWKQDDCQVIAESLRRKVEAGLFADLYWDNIVLEAINQLDIRVIPVDVTDEIDTVEDLREVEKKYNGK